MFGTTVMLFKTIVCRKLL